MKTSQPTVPLAAERAQELVAEAVLACPADAVEVTLLGRCGEYTRFAGERIHQPQDIDELTVSIKAVVNGHGARAATSRLDRVGDTAKAAGALAAGRAAAAGRAGGLTVAEPATAGELADPAPSLWYDDTAAFDAATRVELAGQAMRSAAAAGGRANGMIGRAVTQIAVATSTGISRHAVATEASGSATFTIGDGTAHWIDLSRSADRLDVPGALRAALDRAIRSRGPDPDAGRGVHRRPRARGGR